MSKKHNLQDGFQVISYKKKSNDHTKKLISLQQVTHTEETFNKEVAIRRINEAKEDLLSSDLYSSVLASLKEGLVTLGKPAVKEIVCFGLGRIGECTISRYQLALLLCLKDRYDVKVYVFDPIFTDREKYLLEQFDCHFLNSNTEAKHAVLDSKTTIFYLPHCPKQLTNNLLWSNWGLNLINCIIIANSFTTILENNTKKTINECAHYISVISPYVLELAVINTFKYFDIFNDTAIHVFPSDKLSLISQDFWSCKEEPNYICDDLEYITNKLSQI